MRFACNTKELSKACQTVSRAAAKSANVQALLGVKFSVADGRVGLCGYNLQFGISTLLPVAGAEEDGDTHGSNGCDPTEEWLTRPTCGARMDKEAISDDA